MLRSILAAIGLLTLGTLATAFDELPSDLGDLVDVGPGLYDMRSVVFDDDTGLLLVLDDGRILFRDDPRADGHLDADEAFYPTALDGFFLTADGDVGLYFKWTDEDVLYWHVTEPIYKIRDCGPLTSNEIVPD